MRQLPLATGYEQVPVASSQVSVVQVRLSLHGVPAVQTAAELQVPQLAAAPSSQRVPVRGDHAVWVAAAWHDWHELPALTSPLERQTPPIRQKPDDTGALHTPVESLHSSAVQVRPSLQVVLVAQVPEELQTPQPAVRPSLHVWPVRALHELWLELGLHSWQGFEGLMVPAA
jgi:hypothetical protein